MATFGGSSGKPQSLVEAARICRKKNVKLLSFQIGNTEVNDPSSEARLVKDLIAPQQDAGAPASPLKPSSSG